MDTRVKAWTVDDARLVLAEHGQEHVLRFWESLNAAERNSLLTDVKGIDFRLVDRLIRDWVSSEPPQERFNRIEPIPLIPKAVEDRPDAVAARDAGEEALRQGWVGLFLVAGGQGTRLGFDGPKGAYPIGPFSKKSFFAFHAEKIRNLQRRYSCELPWYIMVSDANEAATLAFFQANAHFGLNPANIVFLKQRMMPCIDNEGRFMLEERGRLAMNPNGHGGCLPAMVEEGVVADARQRGIRMLSYFQVDNWTVKVADPYFIGYHLLRNADMSSKNHWKDDVREAVGVHCRCDGEYRVVEYSELDIYPQLLKLDAHGHMIHGAGNPAIHILSVDFVEWVFNHFDSFPWHRAHKRIPYIDERGERVNPSNPNAYKFETFVFDALRFIRHEPVALEIDRAGEYTPIKEFEGDNSVVTAWRRMSDYWAEWLEAAGGHVPRDDQGRPAIRIEISPEFALTKQEFLSKTVGRTYPTDGNLHIDADGNAVPTA